METTTLRNRVAVDSAEFKKAFCAIKPRKTNGESYGWVGFKWDGIVLSVSCMFGNVRVKYVLSDVTGSVEDFAFAVEWGKVESIVSNSSGEICIELIEGGYVSFLTNSGTVNLKRFDFDGLEVIKEDHEELDTIVLESDGLLSACRTLLPLSMNSSRTGNKGRPYLDCIYIDLRDNNGMVYAYATNAHVMGKFKIAEYSRTLGYYDGFKIPRSVSSILKTYKPTCGSETTSISWNSERLIINCGNLSIYSNDGKLFSAIYPNVENIFKCGEYWIDIPADELKSAVAIGKSMCKCGNESAMAFEVNAEFNNELMRVSIGDYCRDIAIEDYYLPGSTIGKWGMDPIMLDNLLKGFSKRDSVIRVAVGDPSKPIMFDGLGVFSGIQAPILMDETETA